jgi:hypothetical protein
MMSGAAVTRGCLALVFAGVALVSAGQESSFEGTWSASGRRHAVALEDGKEAAIVELSGAVVLASGEGLSGGFRGEVIGFDDGEGLSVGRSVWTDENGDQLFSRLKGGRIETGRRISGTVTGGTGRYAGLSGEYSFTWRYVVLSEDGRIQGRVVDLSGRIRRGE